jgi:hypothetical protein
MTCTTPTSSSWINQIERAGLQSSPESDSGAAFIPGRPLQADIRAFNRYNQNPKPFKWTHVTRRKVHLEPRNKVIGSLEDPRNSRDSRLFASQRW